MNILYYDIDRKIQARRYLMFVNNKQLILQFIFTNIKKKTLL